MNNDLISREALKEAFEDTFYNDYDDQLRTEKLIDNAPTVEPETAICGDWIKHEDYNDSIKYGCSRCGNLTNIPSNFCPNCGQAKKKGGGK